MKSAVKSLANLLESEAVLVTYRKSADSELIEKHFVKFCNEFCDAEACTLHLKSYSEDCEEIIHESQICGFRTFGEGHDPSRIKTPEEIKEEFHHYKQLAFNFENFDDLYFNPQTDLQKLKVCAMLEMTSLDDLNDNSEEALSRLKAFWKKQIDAHKRQTISHINDELTNNSMFDTETIKEIKDLVSDYDPTDELQQIKTKRELFEFWPTLLLPAPDFINEIFVDLFRFSD